MGINRTRAAAAAATLLACGALASAARAEETEASRAARWKDVAATLFAGRALQDGSAMITLDAPPRALDASLVPVSVTIDPALSVKTLTLIIDDNPAPVAATFHFGPAADPHALKTRVRVDQYTLMHAVVETADNRLYAVARFIKAAGGCSAPGTTSEADAMARIGRMKFAVRDPGGDGKPETAELLISHPNFNGMQMNQVTRFYTPARYVQEVRVSRGSALVFSMQGDISLSQDPAITFGMKPGPAAPVDVEVDDSAHGVFRHEFAVGDGGS
jgi:sulfur-oxidizing protein SoxY